MCPAFLVLVMAVPLARAEGLEVHEAPVFVPGKGLAVTSDDESFAIIPRLRVQFLYTAEDPDDENANNSLVIRRARVQFAGYVFGKHNKYKAEFAFSPRDESVGEFGPGLTPLLDWYAEFDYLRDATLRVGQYKVPFNRQRVISSGDLQLVDRALSQGQFTLDRDIGVDLRSDNFLGLDLFKYYAGVWFNQGRDARRATEFEQMYIVRLEVLPFGDFTDYSEGDLLRHDTPKLSIGVAYAFLDESRNDRGILGNPPADGGTTDFHIGTVDALFKYDGLSLYGELYLRDGDRTPGTALDELGQPVPLVLPQDGLGWFIQGGYFPGLADLEIVARYSEIRPVGDHSTLAERHEAGAGLSYYFGGHSLKLQTDFFHHWRTDFATGDEVFRVQLQTAY